MSNLTLVVDNKDSIKHQIIKNLKEHDGKPVSMICALRNISDIAEGSAGLQELVNDGLVERRLIEAPPAVGQFVYYRFRSELGLFRDFDRLKSA